MKNVYRWMLRHKWLLVLILLLTPIAAELLVWIGVVICRLSGLPLDPLNLSVAERYSFLGAYLGGFATLTAVLITVDHSVSERRRQTHRESVLILALQPLADTANLSAISTGMETRSIIVEDSTVNFTNRLPEESLRTYAHYLTNYGKGSAINMMLRLYGKNGELSVFDPPISLLPNERVMLNIVSMVTQEGAREYELTANCSDIYADHYQFAFPFNISYIDAEQHMGITLMSKPVKLEPRVGVWLKLGKLRIPLPKKREV